MKLRMVPISRSLIDFPHGQDISRSRGKGFASDYREQTELDRSIVNRLADPGSPDP